MAVRKKVAQTPDIDAVLERFKNPIEIALKAAITNAAQATPESSDSGDLLSTMYGQIEYHLGWRGVDLSPAPGNPGKLLRPTLTLLAAELAGGEAGVERAMPAAVAMELIHNFSLIHDDIEDGDEARRHRPTVWRLWGLPQAINTGDGLFSLARMQLWELVGRGIAPALVIRLAGMVDRVCLELCEGQHLDMSFERKQDVTVAMYLDMISRKTAALMRGSAELGGRIGAPDNEAVGARLGEFGQALGLAFQLRDDVLGIWAAEKLGKSAAGDIRRKKMSLPVIHALEHAEASDRATLAEIYAMPRVATDGQIAEVLSILDRAGARERAFEALREQVRAAGQALASAQEASAHGGGGKLSAAVALGTLLDFVRVDAGIVG